MGIEQNCLALMHASDEIKKNEKIVMKALTQAIFQNKFNETLRHVSNELVNDSDFKEEIKSLKQINNKISLLREKIAQVKFTTEPTKIEKIAKEKFTTELTKIPEYLKKKLFFWNQVLKLEGISDDEIIMKVIMQQNGLVLKYASDDLKDNEKIVMAAVEENGG